jgi:hypothetical protein
MPSSDLVYFMRVFARSADAPSPQSISDHLRGRRFDVRIESGLAHFSSGTWTRLRVFYAPGRGPLELERQSLHGDAPLPERLRALMDATAASRDERGKRRVLEFLAQARQVFELRIPPDFDWHAARHLVSTELLNYLQKHTDGLIQADQEGYYDRNRIILKLS